MDKRLEKPKGIPDENLEFLFVTSEDKFFGKKEEEKLTVQ